MTAAAHSVRTRSYAVQTAAGVTLAVSIIAAWLACHIYGVFVHTWARVDIVRAPLLIALECWLSVGLFIVAHDCMHGSLAPFRPALNRRLGQLCLLLYAGFSYDRLITKHFDHHRYPGTDRDPDFNAGNPHHFWRWYVTFFFRYFGVTPLVVIVTVSLIYQFAFGVGLANILLFWAAPAVISSVQLFYFGTFLPHRHEDDGFIDGHNSRSSGFSWLMSLLTCFHFGHHHEHHVMPQVPWWRLPGAQSAGRDPA